jgi:aryl-alcohol dehydrogenase
VFIPDMIALYRAGRFPFDKLIKTYRLEDINKAIRDQKLGDVVKAVLLTDAVLN